MKNKSYWIWHYGDYEVFHVMNVHLRREEKGYHRPAFWKISPPYPSVKFKKEFHCESGYLICHINGAGNVTVDQKRYLPDKRIELAPGFHTIEIPVSNYGGIPAVYIESDVCPSDGSWTCNHFAGKFTPVGFLSHFDRLDQNPNDFPFQYQKMLPIDTEQIENGFLFDFGIELFGYLHLEDVSELDEIGVYYGESREEALDIQHTYLIDRICGQKQYRLRQ